jgi:hypothetical protein
MGIPGLAVMTTRFVSAAKLMSRVLGQPDYALAIIDHPISSATDAELEAMARATMADVRAHLVRPGC